MKDSERACSPVNVRASFFMCGDPVFQVAGFAKVELLSELKVLVEANLQRLSVPY